MDGHGTFDGVVEHRSVSFQLLVVEVVVEAIDVALLGSGDPRLSDEMAGLVLGLAEDVLVKGRLEAGVVFIQGPQNS